jgi:predicted nuclease with TOPRIM domain
MSNKPDDVSLDQVRKEYKALQVERENPTLFGLLSQIKSTLTKVGDRFDNLEGDLRDLREEVSKLDGKFEDLENEMRGKMSSSSAHSVDQPASLDVSPVGGIQL